MGLPPQNRKNPAPQADRAAEAYRLTVEDGYTIRELAQHFGCAVGTAHALLHEAIAEIPATKRNEALRLLEQRYAQRTRRLEQDRDDEKIKAADYHAAAVRYDAHFANLTGAYAPTRLKVDGAEREQPKVKAREVLDKTRARVDAERDAIVNGDGQ